jgi:hypothetical protein
MLQEAPSMIVLAVLLLIASGGFAVALVLSNLSAHDQAIQLAGSTIFHWQISGIFLAGVVVAGAFCLGLYLLLAGTRHRLRVASRDVSQRREVRALRGEQATNATALEQERAHLAEELAAERAGRIEDLKTAADAPGGRAEPTSATTDEKL